MKTFARSCDQLKLRTINWGRWICVVSSLPHFFIFLDASMHWPNSAAPFTRNGSIDTVVANIMPSVITVTMKYRQRTSASARFEVKLKANHITNSLPAFLFYFDLNIVYTLHSYATSEMINVRVPRLIKDYLPTYLLLPKKRWTRSRIIAEAAWELT